MACLKLMMDEKGIAHLSEEGQYLCANEGIPQYEDTACYGYESLLNCKMIFQLLYWAYQSFFGRKPQ
jgi:hypothetical protein